MSQPHDPQAHGAPWRPGAASYAGQRPAGPPPSPDLRLLLKLTVASFAVSLLGSVVGALTTSGSSTGTLEGSGLGTVFMVGGFALWIGVTAGLYALVYFPLRARQQWGWVVGISFASMAVLFNLLNVVLFFATGGGFASSLFTSVLKVVVDAAWLVVAVRPGVRGVLR